MKLSTVLSMLFIVIIFSAHMDKRHCMDLKNSIRHNVRWTMFEGCQVEFLPDRWISLETYNFVTKE